MTTRLERRAGEMMLTLTLRKALGLIIATATVLAVSTAVLEWLIDPEFAKFSNALWFSITTVSTVGYGDYAPESAGGRLVASVLMLTGLALIPVITSAVVAVLINQRNKDIREAAQRDLGHILERLDSIERRLAEPK